jgi:hypothetical protein
MPDTIDTPWPETGSFRTPGGRTARLDPAQPLRGIGVEVAGHQDLLLGLDLATGATPPPLVDRWCRGRDLTIVAEPADDRALRAAVTWRFHDDDAGVDAWEAVVSAQTSLLDSDATLAVVSQVDAADVVAGAGAGGWRRVTGGPLPDGTTAVIARRPATSVLVAVHPADVRRIDVSTRDSAARIECRLFASAIEKGVLLRGRVLAAVGPREHDDAWAARLLAAFAASPPPLTT